MALGASTRTRSSKTGSAVSSAGVAVAWERRGQRGTAQKEEGDVPVRQALSLSLASERGGGTPPTPHEAPRPPQVPSPPAPSMLVHQRLPINERALVGGLGEDREGRTEAKVVVGTASGHAAVAKTTAVRNEEG